MCVYPFLQRGGHTVNPSCSLWLLFPSFSPFNPWSSSRSGLRRPFLRPAGSACCPSQVGFINGPPAPRPSSLQGWPRGVHSCGWSVTDVPLPAEQAPHEVQGPIGFAHDWRSTCSGAWGPITSTWQILVEQVAVVCLSPWYQPSFEK